MQQQTSVEKGKAEKCAVRLPKILVLRGAPCLPQVRGRVTHLFTPLMLDRCGTEGQSPDQARQSPLPSSDSSQISSTCSSMPLVFSCSNVAC